MTTILLISLVATAMGLVLGQWTRHTLADLRYRTDQEQVLPNPGSRHWITWTSALAGGSIAAWIAGTDSWTLAPVLLPLTIAGPALAAIDLDVMRLPNRIVGPVALITVAGLASTFATQGGSGTPLKGTSGALIAGGTFWLLSLITRGGIGFGDVKLAAIVGIPLGAVSPSIIFWALVVSAIAAFAWSRASRRNGPLAYGPWLLVGAWLAIIALGNPYPVLAL